MYNGIAERKQPNTRINMKGIDIKRRICFTLSIDAYSSYSNCIPGHPKQL
jgi:hypothetical protein